MISDTPLDTCTAKYGRFLFPKNDIYIGRSLAVYGQYCESEVDLFKKIVRKGDVVVDAGANIGAFSVPLCQFTGPEGIVYSFEPQAFLCAVLSSNLLENKCFNARALTVALGDVAGKITVPNFNYGAKNNFGGISFAKEPRVSKKGSGGLGIPQARLDDVIDVPRLRLIKADVEGMELALLKGAAGLIETHRPYLYLECDKPEATDALIDYLRPYDYQFYWHVSKFFDAKNWKGYGGDVFDNVSCVNLFCAPKEAAISGFLPVSGPASHPRYL